jgi:hypothetical protein
MLITLAEVEHRLRVKPGGFAATFVDSIKAALFVEYGATPDMAAHGVSLTKPQIEW